jgi:hypothetical protein
MKTRTTRRKRVIEYLPERRCEYFITRVDLSAIPKTGLDFESLFKRRPVSLRLRLNFLPRLPGKCKAVFACKRE